MPCCRSEEREYREITFRIGGCQHIEVIAKVMSIPVRIPTDITVGLMVNPVALAIAYTISQAVTGSGLSFPGSCVNRSSVSGNGKIVKIDKSVFNRDIK